MANNKKKKSKSKINNNKTKIIDHNKVKSTTPNIAKDSIPNKSKDTTQNIAKYSTPKISNKGSNILKQFGLENQSLPEPVEISNENIDKLEDKKNEKNKGHIPSKADNIGWNKPMILLRNFLYGFFMGISDGIPGYSGGTTLTIIGFFQQLVNNFKSIFKPDVKKYFWKYFLWTLPFIIAWVGTLYGFMQIVDLASNEKMGVVLVFLFGSFALFSIPLFLFANKSKMVNFKSFALATKKKEKWTLIHWVMIIVFFLLLVGVGIGARFLPTTVIAYDSSNQPIIVHGVTFTKSVDNWVDGSFDAMNILFLLFSGMLAGFCMLIPGISGSLVLFMTTWYPKISQAVSEFHANVNYLPWLIVVALGMIIGLIISSLTISYVLKRWEKIFYSMSLGLIAASPIAIFTALSEYEYAQLGNQTTLTISISMIVVAIIINILIFVLLNETGKINFPKLRIFKSSKINNVKS